jgi:acyl-CoA synthetase (NDP forming)
MKLFFEPRTVALVGASGNPARPGYHLFQNLKISFGDSFYPVNPRAGRIDGVLCHRSVLDIPAEIDLAVIFVPAREVPRVLEECARKGIRRAIIESAGFAEAGPAGAVLQERCLAVARQAGMRLWGPNCMGAIDVPKGKVLSFMNPLLWQGRLVPGSVSLAVQSGMLSAGFLTHMLTRTPFGLAKVCSIGNKIDIDEVDLLEFFLDDQDTGVIAFYVESLPRGRRFFECARSSGKPIVMLKAGRSDIGARAARSHTAALAQDDRVLDGALRQAGVIRVSAMSELFDVARSLALSPLGRRRPRPRVAVLTFSGGGGVVSSDDIAGLHMELAAFEARTISILRAIFPDWMEPANPVDLYPAFEKNGPTETFRTTLEAVAGDPGVDAVYAHLYIPPLETPLFDYDHMAAVVRKHGKPLVVWLLGDAARMPCVRQDLESRGIPVTDEMARGVRILAALAMGR